MHTQEDIYKITIFRVTYMDKGIKIAFFLDEVILFFKFLDQLNLSNIKSLSIQTVITTAST